MIVVKLEMWPKGDESPKSYNPWRLIVRALKAAFPEET